MIENEIMVFTIFTLNYIIINSQTTENFPKFLPCAVEDSNYSVPNILEPNDRQNNNPIDIEIGVFYDDYMYQKFNENDNELEKFIKNSLSGAQAVYNYPSMRRSVNLIVTQYGSVSSRIVPYKRSTYAYFEDLCKWQHEQYPNHEQYDTALFLTARNLVGRGAISKGLGSVGEICLPEGKGSNCVLATAKSTTVMWIIAHEIGHNLGMSHDEVAKCRPGLMGGQLGGSQWSFSWSDCSNNYLKKFIADQKRSECLFRRTGRQIPGWDLNSLPGHHYTLDQQCAINFGKNFKAFNSSHYYYENPCLNLWCSYDLIEIKSDGPIFEGTACFNRTHSFYGYCKAGLCQR